MSAAILLAYKSLSERSSLVCRRFPYLVSGYHAMYGPKYKAAVNTSGYMGSPQGSPMAPVYTPGTVNMFLLQESSC